MQVLISIKGTVIICQFRFRMAPLTIKCNMQLLLDVSLKIDMECSS